jgi:arylsulfatase A-like enzyme
MEPRPSVRAPPTGEKKVAEGVQAPEKYVAMYRGKVKDEKLARYCGAVTCMDEAIGALMDSIEKAGQNGQHDLPVHLRQRRQRQRRQRAAQRQQGHACGRAVCACLSSCAGREELPAGQVTNEFLTALELVPTLLAATGAKAPEGVKLDGFDMLPILRGEAKSPRKAMFWQRRGDKAARFEQLEVAGVGQRQRTLRFEHGPGRKA